MSESFKDAKLAPSGLYVVVRERIGKPGWVVRVLNFATWDHREYVYEAEAEARQAFTLWTL